MNKLKSYQETVLRALREDPCFQQIPKDLVLRRGTFGYLYGTQIIYDEIDQTPTDEYVPSPKDFNKAKTGKEQLEARLTKKKGKPSSLLSQLVNKT